MHLEHAEGNLFKMSLEEANATLLLCDTLVTARQVIEHLWATLDHKARKVADDKNYTRMRGPSLGYAWT